MSSCSSFPNFLISLKHMLSSSATFLMLNASSGPLNPSHDAYIISKRFLVHFVNILLHALFLCNISQTRFKMSRLDFASAHRAFLCNDVEMDVSHSNATKRHWPSPSIDKQARSVLSEASTIVKDPAYRSDNAYFKDMNSSPMELSKHSLFSIFRNGSLVLGLVNSVEIHVTLEITTLYARDRQFTSVNRELSCKTSPLGQIPGHLATTVSSVALFTNPFLFRLGTVHDLYTKI